MPSNNDHYHSVYSRNTSHAPNPSRLCPKCFPRYIYKKKSPHREDLNRLQRRIERTTRQEMMNDNAKVNEQNRLQEERDRQAEERRRAKIEREEEREKRRVEKQKKVKAKEEKEQREKEKYLEDLKKIEIEKKKQEIAERNRLRAIELERIKQEEINKRETEEKRISLSNRIREIDEEKQRIEERKRELECEKLRLDKIEDHVSSTNNVQQQTEIVGITIDDNIREIWAFPLSCMHAVLCL